MARPLVPSSQKALLLELKGLQEEPVEGFRVTLVDEGDLYNWEVAIFGPPNTYYEGGYFKARLKFPIDYPYSPPAFRFLTKMWHPNIYETGDVCISILHPPVDDPQSGELPSERWNPTQNVSLRLLLQRRPDSGADVPTPGSLLPQDHPPERHLPPQRAQHLLAGERGRLGDVPQVEGEQGQGPRVHGHHPEAGPGDQGGRGAGRREGAHHAGRVLRADQGTRARRGLGPLLRRLLRGRRGRGRGRQLLWGRGRLGHRGVVTPRPGRINLQILPQRPAVWALSARRRDYLTGGAPARSPRSRLGPRIPRPPPLERGLHCGPGPRGS
ncbi:ubiquitin-conjugating enzyme E2 R1 isoform X1 [Equus asinus]|uniref:ubiquitin-conjugating enzyme E2 R1 isoform X1 n=2 Tax=Equus asinus TaxID=9793 RepID=UPI001D045CBC|nr:ubiquitin-conjugating enzyme E2 R1 isoform X1 [Equus asinus]